MANEELGTPGRVVLGAIGGVLPFAIRLIQQGASNISQPLPPIGTFYLLAILLSVLIGALASHAFRAHHVVAALYHGATGPIALAFVTGVNTH